MKGEPTIFVTNEHDETYILEEVELYIEEEDNYIIPMKATFKPIDNGNDKMFIFKFDCSRISFIEALQDDGLFITAMFDDEEDVIFEVYKCECCGEIHFDEIE